MPQEEEKPLRNQHLSFAKRLMEYLKTFTITVLKERKKFFKQIKCQTHQIQLKYCACQKECATNQTNHNDWTVELSGIGEKTLAMCDFVFDWKESYLFYYHLFNKKFE